MGKLNPPSSEQLERFKEAARQLETDDNEERFEKRLKKIVEKRSDDKKDD